MIIFTDKFYQLFIDFREGNIAIQEAINEAKQITIDSIKNGEIKITNQHGPSRQIIFKEKDLTLR